MTKPVSMTTVAKRKRVAKAVERIASAALARPIKLALDTCEFVPPGEFNFRQERFETHLGQCNWLMLEVDRHGVSVHIQFEDTARAKGECPGMNPYSGKWNHYLWPSETQSAESFLEDLEDDLPAILFRCLDPQSYRESLTA